MAVLIFSGLLLGLSLLVVICVCHLAGTLQLIKKPALPQMILVSAVTIGVLALPVRLFLVSGGTAALYYVALALITTDPGEKPKTGKRTKIFKVDLVQTFLPQVVSWYGCPAAAGNDGVYKSSAAARRSAPLLAFECTKNSFIVVSVVGPFQSTWTTSLLKWPFL